MGGLLRKVQERVDYDMRVPGWEFWLRTGRCSLSATGDEFLANVSFDLAAHCNDRDKEALKRGPV